MGTNRLERVARKCLFAFMILLTTASAVQAVDSYWQLPPPATGDWLEPSNWTAGLPEYGDNAHILNGGTVTITHGVPQAREVNIRCADTSTVIQSAGSEARYQWLTLGNAEGTTGVYELNDGNLETQYTVIVGGNNGGNGVFRQSGGYFRAGWHYLRIYGKLGGSGTFELTGGELDASYLHLAGNGCFHQSAGTAKITSDLRIYDGGRVELNGGKLTVIDNIYCGKSGTTGAFTQTGGEARADQLHIGYDSGSVGVYELRGTGHLADNIVFVGSDNAQGRFVQSGGTHIVYDTLYVDRGPTGYDASYDLSGGHLSAAGLEISGGTALKQTGGTSISTIFLSGAGISTNSPAGVHRLLFWTCKANWTLAVPP